MPMISVKEVLLADLDRELAVTRTVLERLPMEKAEWKPHDKSMSLGKLAFHVATLPGWAQMTLETDGIDFATATPPQSGPYTTPALLECFDRAAARLRAVAHDFEPVHLGDTWTVRHGPQVLTQKPRLTVFRVWCMNHLIHHRAQLCLYLRLMNVPVPTVYFNTADDPSWMFE